MGRLGGFRYREVTKRLKKLGFEFDRQAAGPHEIWYNPATRAYTTIPTTQETYLKARSARSCARLGSSRRTS